MNVLETKKLTKHFDGVHAVDKLSISIERGKVTGVVGPNGSGKSTLINVLTGIFPIDSGEIIIADSRKLQKIQAHEAKNFGMTRSFQDVRLFEQMPVLDNVLVVLTERNVASALFEKHKEFHLAKAREVLEHVGLWDKEKELAVNLSYGQRKLLEIARVLAMDSSIILLDEPYAGLFPEMRKIVSKTIKKLRDEGKTIVLIEHNMEIIRELCDHLIVMDSGELLAEGKPNEVLKRRDVVEAYLGE